MKIVLDTNLLLTCISERSHLHWIFQALLDKKFTLCVTTEILSEYAEIIGRHMGESVMYHTLEGIMKLSNIEKIETYYKWNLIKDADDNKFVDCAVACNAKFIVTHDKHFNILKDIPFPELSVISAEQFKIELDNQT